jgi:hypothetical protein
MKKNVLLLFLFFLQGSIIAQSSYNSNGQSGFGGGIGLSTLSVTDNGTMAVFVLTRGAGPLNDFFTLYIDSKTGGFSTTALLNDQADLNRKSISGISGAGRSLINFPSGFSADFAISFSAGSAGLFTLANGADNSLGFVKSLNIPGSNFATSTFSLTKQELGIATADPFTFSFLGSYGNPNDPVIGYNRSNEGYGTGLPANNPGNNTINFSGSLVYPLITTPLTLNSFSGVVKNEIIELRWTTVSEQNLDKFLIQKSTNGLNFYTIGELVAKNLPTGASYITTDNSLHIGNNFYRIIARNNNGDKAFSKVIRIYYGKIDNNLTLFPNPSREFLNINFMSAVRGSYTLDIFTDGGQKLVSQRFEHNGVDKIINLTLPTSMKKGPYRVYISNQYEFYKGTFIVQ